MIKNSLFFILTFGKIALPGSDLLPSLNEHIYSKGQQITEGYITEKQQGFFYELLQNQPQITHIAEIGFNAGHSSEAFLLARPDTFVTSFDIMHHNYARTGKEYIDQKYPGRHVLVKGDSRHTVNQFAKENPTLFFDLIFIDGGHGCDNARIDILNMRKLALPHTLVIFDDMQMDSIRKVWTICVRLGIIEQIELFSTQDRAWVLGRYVCNE